VNIIADDDDNDNDNDDDDDSGELDVSEGVPRVGEVDLGFARGVAIWAEKSLNPEETAATVPARFLTIAS
jgi:hypothetical protein